MLLLRWEERDLSFVWVGIAALDTKGQTWENYSRGLGLYLLRNLYCVLATTKPTHLARLGGGALLMLVRRPPLPSLAAKHPGLYLCPEFSKCVDPMVHTL